MTDGAALLSRISGLSRTEVLNIWLQVKADKAKAAACPRHLFKPKAVRIGQRVTCEHCGVAFSLTDAGAYIRGYEARGGDANDVWPGFHGPAGAAP